PGAGRWLGGGGENPGRCWRSLVDDVGPAAAHAVAVRRLVVLVRRDAFVGAPAEAARGRADRGALAGIATTGSRTDRRPRRRPDQAAHQASGRRLPSGSA